MLICMNKVVCMVRLVFGSKNKTALGSYFDCTTVCYEELLASQRFGNLSNDVIGDILDRFCMESL